MSTIKLGEDQVVLLVSEDASVTIYDKIEDFEQAAMSNINEMQNKQVYIGKKIQVAVNLSIGGIRKSSVKKKKAPKEKPAKA